MTAASRSEADWAQWDAAPSMAAAGGAAPIEAKRMGKVGVLMGGRSAERTVSLRSGQAVLAALLRSGVDAHGFDTGTHSIAALAAAGFDRVFIALHGRHGEDGCIQGALELLGVPYTGSGVLASAMAMDKRLTKRLWAAEDIPTPAWLDVDAGQRAQLDCRRMVAELGDALIVKPSREGSTIGITKVTRHEDEAHVQLAAAIDAALLHDDEVLVEELISGPELTCAIIGQGSSARALPLVEIRAPEGNYDFHHKYDADDTQYLCPAPLDDHLAQAIQALCLKAYVVLGARGWGRVDVMVHVSARGDRPYLLELNTSPGMTDHSLVPMAALAAGIGFDDLVLALLADAALDTPASGPRAGRLATPPPTPDVSSSAQGGDA